mgnify:CR=1 FL=1
MPPAGCWSNADLKNIVKALLENYQFRVIDLGKDVPPETVVEAVKESHAPLVGLSALMTTTVESMAPARVYRVLASRTPFHVPASTPFVLSNGSC